MAILQELAEHQPVLFILEDLHWTDPTTLELLNLLIDQTPTASLLVLLTCRPHFQPAWHHRSYLTEIAVNRLPHTQTEQIITGITDGKTFPAAVLQDSLMARLDRLMTAKVIAQLGATIGRQFSYALLQAVSQLDEVMLQHELGRLVEAEIVYHRGVPPQATYTFKHALIQDAAYESLLKSTWQQYHQRITQVLEAQFPETAETQPELLAHHCTEASLIAQAVGYWQRAGEHASDRSAYLEAISHLTTGIELLQVLPETSECTQQALTLHITLGTALQNAKGHAAPEVEHVYAQARALCQQVGGASCSDSRR